MEEELLPREDDDEDYIKDKDQPQNIFNQSSKDEEQSRNQITSSSSSSRDQKRDVMDVEERFKNKETSSSRDQPASSSDRSSNRDRDSRDNNNTNNSEKAGDRETSLYVGNLDPNIKATDLEKLFEKKGKVTKVDIKYGGFAFVFLNSGAEEALKEFDGSDFHGRKIKVQIAKGDGRVRKRENERKDDAQHKPNSTLFVVNFDPDRTRTAHLLKAFSPFGTISRIEKRPNFAFVGYETVEQATEALAQMNGAILHDRELKVEYVARSQPTSSQSHRSHQPPRSRSPSPTRRHDHQPRSSHRREYSPPMPSQGRRDSSRGYPDSTRSRSPPHTDRYPEHHHRSSSSSSSSSSSYPSSSSSSSYPSSSSSSSYDHQHRSYDHHRPSSYDHRYPPQPSAHQTYYPPAPIPYPSQHHNQHHNQHHSQHHSTHSSSGSGHHSNGQHHSTHSSSGSGHHSQHYEGSDRRSYEHSHQRPRRSPPREDRADRHFRR